MPESKEKPPTLFEVMRILSATQRQELGAIRRKMKEKPGTKEKLEKGEDGWMLNYYKGKKKLAEAKLEPQKLEYQEF